MHWDTIGKQIIYKEVQELTFLSYMYKHYS